MPLLLAALVLVEGPPAAAQDLDSTELDPSAPLDPLPDLGVDWPDLETEPMVEIPLEAEQPVAAAPPAATAPDTQRRFSVAIDGIDALAEADRIREAFDQQSALAQSDDDEANAAQIERRSRSDVELLTELLKSQGYYSASVEIRIEPAGGAIAVVLDVEPGPQYVFESVELPGLDAAGDQAGALRESFAVQDGDPVIAADVIAAELALRLALGEQGFAFAEVGDRLVEIDDESRRGRLVLPVEPGPRARFGQIRVGGTPPFPPRHVAQIARFETGDLFKRSLVDDLRRALVATGLVSSAEVNVVRSGDGEVVDLQVQLEPAPMRTIAGELGYGTGEGARAEVSWQHRNFVNPEGALTVRAVAGTREQAAAVEFRRSNFRARDQILNLKALASNIERDAYDAETIQLGAGIERQSNIIFQKTWTWGLGIDLIATDERGIFADPATKETRTFLIAALPAHLHYDGTDNLFDPTSGFRLGARVSPEISALKGTDAYVKLQVDSSAYRKVSPRVVMAGRVRLATLAGAPLASVAPSRRLYSGGGGSVRGYGYQQLGPKDSFNDPIGGRSLAEFAIEARIRPNLLGGNFGIVPFLDGGTLSTRSTPDFGNWQFGTGLGLRYYSSFGPIRLDFGVPLNRQPGDARFAVTVSLGQAF